MHFMTFFNSSYRTSTKCPRHLRGHWTSPLKKALPFSSSNNLGSLYTWCGLIWASCGRIGDRAGRGPHSLCSNSACQDVHVLGAGEHVLSCILLVEGGCWVDDDALHEMLRPWQALGPLDLVILTSQAPRSLNSCTVPDFPKLAPRRFWEIQGVHEAEWGGASHATQGQVASKAPPELHALVCTPRKNCLYLSLKAKLRACMGSNGWHWQGCLSRRTSPCSLEMQRMQSIHHVLCYFWAVIRHVAPAAAAAWPAGSESWPSGSPWWRSQTVPSWWQAGQWSVETWGAEAGAAGSALPPWTKSYPHCWRVLSPNIKLWVDNLSLPFSWHYKYSVLLSFSFYCLGHEVSCCIGLLFSYFYEEIPDTG